MDPKKAWGVTLSWSLCLVGVMFGSIQPWMAMVACGKFYKFDSLAVATRISYNYQVLLDDGNRIIFSQGNFKILIFDC